MYLRSSELQNINGKNYIRIYLEKDYSFVIKHNGEEISMNNILLEEPNSNDVVFLKKLGMSLERLFTYTNAIKPLQLVSFVNSDLIENINSFEDSKKENLETQNIEEYSEKLSPQEKARIFIRDIFLKANDFQNQETDYYLELQKFIDFVESKLYRDLDDNNPLSTNFEIFEKYLAESFIIKEELIIEYFSFFFAHLPSRSLQIQARK